MNREQIFPMMENEGEKTMLLQLTINPSGYESSMQRLGKCE